MAHDLYIEDGKASMMYVGKEPWHGLGTKLEEPATAAEAIKAAKLDWEVVKAPLFAIGGSVALPVADKFAMVPGDKWGKPDCPVFGIVGKDYTPLQNREAFSFFDDIVGQGEAIYHTAGALGKGERVWILAKLPSDIRVVGDDIANKFLLLSNSHDGASSVQIKFTPVRVVCQNTLTMALSQVPTIRVVHARDMKERLKLAQQTLGLIRDRFDEIEISFQAMAKVKMNEEKVSSYLNLVFPNPRDPDNEKAWERVERARSMARHYYQENEVKGTLWAAYNGVTEYVDHHRVKAGGERRLQSIWFGNGYHIKARAFRIAEEQTRISLS
jgi:phage/plasmid-like protein (TIGR03299 family)